MNNSNFFRTSSSDAYEEGICLYYDSIAGFKSTRKSLTIPQPICTSVYGLSELENNEIRDIPPFISKHIKNNNNTNVSFNQTKPPSSLADAHTKHYSSNYNPSYRKLPDDDEDLLPRPPPVPTRILSGKMSLVTKDPNGIMSLDDDVGSNLSAVLREKMPNNEIYYSQGKWHCGEYKSDVFPINQGSNFRICAKQKDNRFVERANTKRKLRTRSESDPNEDPAISSSNSSWYPIEDSLTVINVSKTDPIPTAALYPSYSDRRAKKLPATPKRHSPARVLLYNNNTSPRLVRNLAGHSSSPVRGRRGSSLNRLSEQRRSRTKSPSLSRVTSNDSLAEYDMHFPSRKSKTNVTTPVGGSVIKSMSDANRERLKLLSPIDVDVDRISDCTSVDDDADISDTESNFGNSYDSADSSDSDEDGYRSHAYKVTTSDEKFATLLSSSLDPAISLSPQPSQESLVNPDSLLVPSLFPNVPPYLAFSSNSTKGPDVPADLFKILKWKVSTVMPKIVRHVLANSGVRLLKKTNDWMGTWGKHMKSNGFKTIRPYQKINHLPGSFKIGRKDNCWKNLQRLMVKYGKKEFGFMPKTYILPNDLNILRKAWPKYAQRNVKWIIKPPASARGTGIRVVHRWGQIPKRRPLIVQRYIERPLLINGSKFDLRLYVLVTSINPLRVYMYHNGLARFASVKYSAKSDTLHERCMHLTNYSINKLSSNYSKNEDVNACHGHKWTIKSLMAYLSDRGVHTERLWEALRNLVMRTLLAGEQAINSMVKVNVESKYSCFELFGFDVLLDADLVPWLLEVNISPSLHSELPLDTYVKAPLVQGVLNTALYNIPPRLSPEKQKEIGAKMGFPAGPLCFDKRLYINYLSRAEKVKHNQFTRKTLEDRDDYLSPILEHLTPDDVRCLIVAEDEFARCAPLERIFPTCDTHKYLKYTETPRYYNRLLDAWESRYAKNRSAGIKLLQQYCERKYHLEVPPSPTRKLPSPSVSDESAEEYVEGDEDTQSSDDMEEEIPCVPTRTLRMTRSTLALTTAIKAIRRKHRKLYISAYKRKTNTTMEENDEDSENDEQL